MTNDCDPIHVGNDPYTQFQYEILEFFHITKPSHNSLCNSNDMSPFARILGFYLDGYFLLQHKALSYDFLIQEDIRFDELISQLLLFVRNYWNPDKYELLEYFMNKTRKQLNYYIDYYSNLIETFYDYYSDTTINSVANVKYVHDLLLQAHDLLLDYESGLLIYNDHSVIHTIENKLHQLRLSILNSKSNLPQISDIEKKIYMTLYDSIIPMLLFYRCFDD